MNRQNLLKNRLLVYLISLYTIGLVFGLFIRNNASYSTSSENKNFFSIFFSNYWYIFLIWLFGFSIIGYLISSMIVFVRGFIFGILIRILIVNNFSIFMVIFVLELLLALPVLIVIAYVSLNYSKDNFKILFNNYSNSVNINKYINLMLIATIIIVVYSLLIYIN